MTVLLKIGQMGGAEFACEARQDGGDEWALICMERLRALITATSSAALCFPEQFCILPGAVQGHGAPAHRTALG